MDQCTENCYLQYFLSRSVPAGLDLSNSAEMSCICQKDDKGNDCFATYFYDDAGIAAYSAYTIQAAEMSCICQKDDKGNDCFATYFYDDAGIAAYSAYTIQASDAGKIGTYDRPPDSWKTTPGW